jgi:Na+/proline symporter
MIYYAIILITTVIIFTLIGLIYSKGKVSNLDDFLLARGTTNIKYLTSTFIASFLGVFILFTPSEAGAIGGVSTIIGYAIGVATLYLAFLILSPKVREYLPEGSTIKEYTLKRYGKKMYVFTVLLSLFYMLVHLIAELTAIAQVSYQLTNVPLLYTAFLVGIGTMVYTTYGGLKASIFTDFVQMTVIGVILIIITAGLIYYSDGIAQTYSQITLNRPDLLDFSNRGGIEYGLTLCIGVFAANLFHQGYWQRIYSGKNDKTIKKSLWSSIFVVVPIMLVAGTIGIISAGLNVAENPSVALFSLIYSLFPTQLIVLVFILAILLVMSTVDTLLNAISATLVNNKSNSGSISLTKIRIITILLTIFSSLLASRGYSVLYLFLVADLICAGAFVPLFFGLFNPNLKEGTAIMASILGIASGIPFFVNDKLLISFLVPILVSLGLCILGSFKKVSIEQCIELGGQK